MTLLIKAFTKGTEAFTKGIEAFTKSIRGFYERVFMNFLIKKFRFGRLWWGRLGGGLG
jgi:hypothetical protein